MGISIELNENGYLLAGDIDSIRSRRRVKSNFESYGAQFNSSSKIFIPFSTKDNPNDYGSEEDQYKVIIRLLNKFNIEFVKTQQVDELVSDIDRENEKFEIFSEKAKSIRNNIHSGDDFERFTSVVSNKLTRTLYSLQLLSSYHLAFSQNACNFSVPGAGKTSIVYAAYAYLSSMPVDSLKYINKLLIISPLAAFGPWKKEYKKCFGKETSVKELVGLSAMQRQEYFYSDTYTEITLISYQSASNESDVVAIKDFLKRKGNRVMVVLDEAHRIKNTEGGKWAEAVLSIAKYASSRVVLTGTPAPNGYQDLYNLYKFIWPEKNIISFPLNYLQELSTNQTPSVRNNIQKLINDVSPFFIRVKKSDLGLPDPVNHQPIIVPMGNMQREIYDYIERKYVNYFENNSDSNEGFLADLKKAKLIRLMQCATNPVQLNKAIDKYSNSNSLNPLDVDDRGIMGLIQSYGPNLETPPKFLKALELIKDIVKKSGADGKVIVWSIFVQNIYSLQEYLNSNGIDCELLYGDTPTGETNFDIRNREDIINRFHQEDCPFKVIIANPFAVGESISLHKACHNAIYLEKSFNAAMYMQSKDRVHRYGLSPQDIINYYHLVSEDSVDCLIHDRVLEKEETMLEVIESEEIPLLNMNMDEYDDSRESDIQAIIRYYHAKKLTKTQ